MPSNEKQMVLLFGAYALFNLYGLSSDVTGLFDNAKDADGKKTKSAIQTAMLAYAALLWYLWTSSMSKNDVMMYFLGGHFAIYTMFLKADYMIVANKQTISMLTFSGPAK